MRVYSLPLEFGLFTDVHAKTEEKHAGNMLPQNHIQNNQSHDTDDTLLALMYSTG